MRNRIGRFVMSRHLVEEEPEQAMKIMSRCVVVRCELMFASDCFEYLAMSPDFDEVLPGFLATEYVVRLSKDDEGNIACKLERK